MIFDNKKKLRVPDTVSATALFDALAKRHRNECDCGYCDHARTQLGRKLQAQIQEEQCPERASKYWEKKDKESKIIIGVDPARGKDRSAIIRESTGNGTNWRNSLHELYGTFFYPPNSMEEPDNGNNTD